MIRRVLMPAVLLAALGAASPALAQTGGACSLTGTATWASPITNNGGEFGWTGEGTVSNCQGQGLGESSGTFVTGKGLTINGVQYKPYGDPPRGSPICLGGGGKGTTLIKWASGKLSMFSMNSTFGVITPVTFQDKVTLQRVVPDPLDPNHVSDTFSLTLAGKNVGGFWGFGFDPATCNTAGTKTGTITAVLGIAKES